MSGLRGVNIALRFALELCALAALAVGGASVHASAASRVLLAVALPAIAAVLWGLFVAPRASISAPRLVRVVAEFAVFAGAVVALAATSHALVAAVLAAAILVNEVLLTTWHQRAAETGAVG